jgi:hypothetical protein
MTMDSTNEKVDRRTPVFVSDTLQTFDKVNVSRKARYLVRKAGGITAMRVGNRQFRQKLSILGCRFRTMPPQPPLTPHQTLFLTQLQSCSTFIPQNMKITLIV